LEREVEERFDKDNVLKDKMTWDCHFFLQSIKRLESHLSFRGEPHSRIRRVRSGNQVFGRGATSSYWSYCVWEFGDFFCLIFLVILLLCNLNKIL